jgi:integrase
VVAFADWQHKPLSAISKDMVAKRHAELGTERGEAYANLAMHFLRSLYNFALAEYEDRSGVPLLPYNSVERLNKTHAWYRDTRRQTLIKLHQLPAWFRAVQALGGTDANASGAVVRDYLLLLLFTGLRRQEGMRLHWDDVDLLHKTLTVPDTKNHEPLVLPLSDFVADLLDARRREALIEYVSPAVI